ncbi:MAG: efflux RND transporter periplasmic adaptor subunit [Deltaproteobacteria bacterium]|nr:efflux RND transporter periplasmic adaptor subunit [Deltaproteobacteria bacterium]
MKSAIFRPVLPILLLASLALQPGCGRNDAESKAPAAKGAAEAVEEVPVRVAAAQRTAIQRKVEFVGSLAGVEQVTLSSEVEGTIEKIHADLGDPVRKGQVLLSVAADEFRFRKEQARAEAEQIAAKLGIASDAVTADIDGTSLVRKAVAEYENARTDLDRRRGLFGKNLIARKEVDDAEARYLVAEANVRAAREEANNLLATLRSKRAQLSLAEKKWRDTQVRSPIDGSVEARLVSAGEYVKVGTPMFRLVNDRPVRMLGEVPEFYAAALTPGLAVDLTVDSRPGKVYRGTLKRIAPSSNVANRAIQVEAFFPNPSQELKSGFFGKGAILLRVDRDGVAIPKQAVVTFAGIEKVFVVSAGTARERKVKLGDDLGDRVEVVEGVAAGDKLAVSNTGKLVEGAKVLVSAEEGR